MTWVKIDDLITEHPKFVGLTDAAWTLWIHGLAYSGRNLTDGLIPTGMLRRLCNTANPAKAAAELVTTGLWDLVPAGWEIHDYCEHQRTSDEVEEQRASASKGATRGNHNRWHTARGKTDPSCQWCISATDPQLTPKRIAPESVTDHRVRGRVRDRETNTKDHRVLTSVSDDAHGGTDQRTDTAIDLIADYELELAKGRGGTIDDTAAYRASIAQRIRRDHHTELDATSAAHPDWTPEQLRDRYLEPEALTSLDDLVPGAVA